MKYMKRILNWKPSPEDTRDRLFAQHLPLITMTLPPTADITAKGWVPVIRDQGSLGCCVGMASVAALEFVLRMTNDPFHRRYCGSSLFAYYNARDEKEFDTGAYVRDSIKAMAKIGVCTVHYWPFRDPELRFHLKPSDNAFTDATKWMIKDYMRVRSLNELRIALTFGFPVILGFECFSGIDLVGEDGVVPDPEEGEQSQGGHAVCVVGYNDTLKRIKFRNSWGREWGKKGYGYISYDYLDKYSDDWWVIRK